MQCPYFRGLENRIVNCEFRNFAYETIAAAKLRLKTRCHGQFEKCNHYRCHQEKHSGVACPEYIHKSKHTIYCKKGQVTYQKQHETTTYYLNKCCSDTGHKTCCNNPNKVEHKEQKKQQISFIDEIIFTWKHRKGAV
jgi:hypothetical protein